MIDSPLSHDTLLDPAEEDEDGGVLLPGALRRRCSFCDEYGHDVRNCGEKRRLARESREATLRERAKALGLHRG